MTFKKYWQLHLVIAQAALNFERARVAAMMVAYADRVGAE